MSTLYQGCTVSLALFYFVLLSSQSTEVQVLGAKTGKTMSVVVRPVECTPSETEPRGPGKDTERYLGMRGERKWSVTIPFVHFSFSVVLKTACLSLDALIASRYMAVGTWKV